MGLAVGSNIPDYKSECAFPTLKMRGIIKPLPWGQFTVCGGVFRVGLGGVNDS